MRCALALCALLAMLGPAAAEPAREPAPQPMGPLGERDLVIANRSGRAISGVFVSPTAVDSWGSDRLGEQALEPGRTLRLRLGRMRDCAFDILVVYEDTSREERAAHNVCRTRQAVFDGRTSTYPATLGVAPRPVVVANQSAQPIQQLFVSAADATQWGEDLLDSAISVGERTTVIYRGACTADVRVVFANRAAEERRGMDLCRLPMLSVEPGWTTAEEPPVPPA